MTHDDLQQIKELLLGEREENRKFLREALEENNAVLFGQLTRHFDEKIESKIGPLRTDISKLHTIMDGIAKRITDDEQEHSAVAYQVDRHERWIGQLSQAANVTLVPEQ